MKITSGFQTPTATLDLLLKKLLRRSCSIASRFCLFLFFTSCAFVRWVVSKQFSLICLIKLPFVQRTVSHDVSPNMTIFCWLLIQRFCSLCSTKLLIITFSQRRNCLYSACVKSSYCFFNTSWNDIFNWHTFEKMISARWLNHLRKFSKTDWWYRSI